MYNIEAQLFENTFDVMTYTISAMKEVGYEKAEIDEYIAEAISGNNYNLITVSEEKISECNRIVKQNTFSSFDDTWRDYYYEKQLYGDESYDWDDDFDENRYSNKRHYYWEDDIVDDSDQYEGFQCDKYWDSVYVDDDDEDAYEGFSCCHHPYYSAIDEDN